MEYGCGYGLQNGTVDYVASNGDIQFTYDDGEEANFNPLFPPKPWRRLSLAYGDTESDMHPPNDDDVDDADAGNADDDTGEGAGEGTGESQ